MKTSQPDIQALQTRLQAIQSGRSQSRQSLPSKPLTSQPFPPDLKTPYSPPPSHPVADRNQPTRTTLPSGEHPAALVESLQQRSLDCIRKLQSLPAQPLLALPDALPKANPDVDVNASAGEGRQRLDAQAQRVNQLAVAQEAALKELKAIAQQLEQGPVAPQHREQPSRPRNRAGNPPALPMLDCLEAAVPHLEPDEHGGWVLTTRSIDFFEEDREAALTADRLRQHNSQQRHRRRDRPQSQWGAIGKFWVKQFTLILGQIARTAAPRRRQVSSRIRRSPQVTPNFSLQTGLWWSGGAVVMRVILDAVLVAFPGLWLPVIGLVVAPAAIALYQSTIHPETSFIWGCRLFLILFGLLLGGRF